MSERYMSGGIPEIIGDECFININWNSLQVEFLF